MKYLAYLFISFAVLSCAPSEPENTETSTTTDIDAQVDPSFTDTLIEEENASWVYTPLFNTVPHLKAKDGCFPYPSERFLSWQGTDTMWNVIPDSPHEIYTYLAVHFDSLGEKTITKKDTFWGPIAWHQEFTNGFYFERHRYPEAGGDGLLKTSCTDRDSFYRSFIALVETEDNTWNSDSTKYEPEGAGCYYDIKVEEDETYSVSWYCGC